MRQPVDKAAASPSLSELGSQLGAQARNRLVRGRNIGLNIRLTEAVLSGSVKRVESALRAGADPNAAIVTTHKGRSPTKVPAMLYCEARDKWQVADALLAAGADPNSAHPYSKRSSLGISAEKGWHPAAQKHVLNLIHAGADVTAPIRVRGGQTGLLHLVLSNRMTKVLKPALLHGAEAEAQNEDGMTPEQLLLPHASLIPAPTQGGMAYWTVHQHTHAPCPDVEAGVNAESLRQKNAAGYCALDHWQCWDRYDEVQKQLEARGEPLLKARDLLGPLGGREGMPNRLEVMAHLCPDLLSQLADPDLWKGENLHVLRAFRQQMPEHMRDSLPFYSLQQQLSQEEMGRSSVMGR